MKHRKMIDSEKNRERILAQLNESQQEAVKYMDGAQLVIAGAGSGKTRVLTYKIAYLLNSGYEPFEILALTFTNKAAREMKERINNIIDSNIAKYLNVGTFHSVFLRILRNEAERIGYNSNLTIYDQSDSKQLIKSIIDELKLDVKVYKPTAVANRISSAKNKLLLPQAYASSYETVKYDVECRMPAIKDIYLRYAERCRQSNVMDFDDILVNTYTLLNNNEDIRKKYEKKFRYVLVDEYQDTNYVQQEILRLLTEKNQMICAVGDDAQSIYSFRGANIDNMLNFKEWYGGNIKLDKLPVDLYNENERTKDPTKLFKLEQNYRSTQVIVQAANSLIKHNKNQIEKESFSCNDEGDKLQLKPAYSDKEEALIVCKEIKRIKRADNAEYSDFAILYRTNAQSRSFEEYFRKEGIPYRIYGGLSFYQRKEIKDIIAYFRTVVNPHDEESLKRIINYPSRGIGDTTVNKITATANDNHVSLWDVMCAPDTYGLNVNKGTLAKLDTFRNMVQAWIDRATTDDAHTLGMDIINQSGVSRDINSSNDPEAMSRQENMLEFVGGLHDFVESRREEDQADQIFLADFLQEVSLMTDLDSDGDDDSPKVSLMTIHSAKGLEFPTVFIVGLEENIFPSPMSCNSPRELEEERRLLYVAITRAERHCIMTCAKNRFRYGRMEFDTPSRFIRDIDPKLVHVAQGSDDMMPTHTDSWRTSSSYSRSEWMQNPHPVATQFRADPKPRIVAPRREEKPQSPFSESFARTLKAAGAKTVAVSSASDAQLSVGSIVEHQRFGRGRVINIEGIDDNSKATVAFENTGTKQLLLKFARLKVIG